MSDLHAFMRPQPILDDLKPEHQELAQSFLASRALLQGILGSTIGSGSRANPQHLKRSLWFPQDAFYSRPSEARYNSAILYKCVTTGSDAIAALDNWLEDEGSTSPNRSEQYQDLLTHVDLDVKLTQTLIESYPDCVSPNATAEWYSKQSQALTARKDALDLLENKRAELGKVSLNTTDLLSGGTNQSKALVIAWAGINTVLEPSRVTRFADQADVICEAIDKSDPELSYAAGEILKALKEDSEDRATVLRHSSVEGASGKPPPQEGSELGVDAESAESGISIPSDIDPHECYHSQRPELDDVMRFEQTLDHLLVAASQTEKGAISDIALKILAPYPEATSIPEDKEKLSGLQAKWTLRLKESASASGARVSTAA